ncbi:hypothetical protein V9K67_10580 [Paraflavisolibacter sp. H34]|uniref:baeRF3 domain-containing protein n=1 Tax=Huijunlia imazamoxiresistens TaxID=3127457 RepID=UPI003017EF38
MVPGVFQKEEQLLFESGLSLPSVSLVLPFDPASMTKAQIEYGLKTAMDKVMEELYCNFPKYIVRPALNRLKTIFSALEYSTLKKSIAIFLSPFEEKVYYLDIPVRERVVVNKTLDFRELVQQKKEERKYLVLAVNGHTAKIYLGNGSRLTRLVTNRAEHLVQEGSAPARMGKTASLISFLKYVDYGLSIILKAYPYPLFVVAERKTMNAFQAISNNDPCVVEHIHQVYHNETEEELLEAVQPYLAAWKKTKEKDVLLQVENALHKGKLAVGIHEVWQAASEKRGKLLVVESDYKYPAYFGEGEGVIYVDFNSDHHAQNIKEAVDNAIEKVLASGGDVEFVEPGTLSGYLRIALILQ